MTSSRTRTATWMRFAVAAAALAVLTTSCTSTSAPHASQSAGNGITQEINNYAVTSGSAKSSGGTVYWAQLPQNHPNSIFPMINSQVCTLANVQFLFSMLYRPLFWFGNSNRASIDYDYSIGKEPVYSNNNQTVTINLNDWKWSNGEPVTSQNVALWIALEKGNPAANSCYYVPPAANGEKFFPDNVQSVETPSPSTVVLHLTQSYNPTWFTYNELSQITPLPMAWYATSMSEVGKNLDATVDISATKKNQAIYDFLNKQSADSSTWVDSPIWSVVDGPFKLSAFTPTGEVDMVPNQAYSGSPKPSISKFVELPFTDNNAELTALKTLGVGGLTVGYLPPEDAGQLKTLQSAGYAAQSAYSMSLTFFPLNMNNATMGPTFRQAYFRQAFQHLVDQHGWLTAFLNGWGQPTVGPVPPDPPNPFADAAERSNPFPHSVTSAKQLLTSHGWTVNPGGVSVCSKPGAGADQCGQGVLAGTKLEFNLDYESGVASVQSEMQQLQSEAAQVGIKLNLTSHDSNTVVGTAFTPCKPGEPACSWTAENYGTGWFFGPNFEPTGEVLFLTGAAANTEHYDDAKANDLILKTTTASESESQSAFDAYQDYIIDQVPVVFEPASLGNPAAGGPALISQKLGGVAPNAFAYITPEAWYFTS